MPEVEKCDDGFFKSAHQSPVTGEFFLLTGLYRCLLAVSLLVMVSVQQRSESHWVIFKAVWWCLKGNYGILLPLLLLFSLTAKRVLIMPRTHIFRYCFIQSELNSSPLVKSWHRASKLLMHFSHSLLFLGLYLICSQQSVQNWSMLSYLQTWCPPLWWMFRVQPLVTND